MLREYAAAVTQPALGDEQVRYDELTAPDGSLRPAWKGLGAQLSELGGDRLRRVRREIGRFLADDGVTYTRPGEAARPWRLDPLPVVLAAGEWAELETGLVQRAELLNALLADLYGPRRVLSTRTVPAPVVLAHRGYLRSMARPGSVETQPLLLAATDLGRTAAGRWQVLADRTQAPSGLGYAMENRRVVSRVLPELYREAGLHRAAPYFQALRSALLAAAPGDGASPRVVVLTPGPHSETAYDQAFVASILGFPLVEGRDLTVRGGAVWMRVLGRLERVDVVVRRVDAAWSDPLELRGDSELGVAGLSEAARRGTVRVVNGLGTGVLENPGLLPFLPQVCELLLGEPLRLPSLPTRWLGDPAALAEAEQRLDDPDVVVRSLDGSAAAGRGVPTDPDALRELLRRAPHRYVLQDRPPVSQAPTLDGADVVPRPVALRTFAIRYGSSYRPLVGGLASVLADDRTVSSKDVWVLKSTPEEPDQGLGDVLPMTNVRAPAAMVPRVLADMFWFGRHTERAEDMLRLLLQAHVVADDFRGRPRSSGGTLLAVLLGAMHDLSPALDDGPDLDADFRSVLLDARRPGSAARSLAALRDAAQGSRDQLSPDLWRALGETDRAVEALQDSVSSHQVAESAGRMLTAVLAVHGVTAQMLRDPSWRMIEIGRALERCQQLVRLLRSTATSRRGLDVDRSVLQAVLTVAESSVTYRRRHRDDVRLATVLDLLLLEPENPRSLLLSLTRLREHLGALPDSTGSTRPERLVADALGELDGIDLAQLATVDGERRPHLDALLDSLARQLDAIGDAVVELHLAAGPARRAFGLGPTRRRRAAEVGP
ncbi:MAG: circularly permuted type 2 ATP-grasp protein [Aeromicrobium erythreum]